MQAWPPTRLTLRYFALPGLLRYHRHCGHLITDKAPVGPCRCWLASHWLRQPWSSGTRRNMYAAAPSRARLLHLQENRNIAIQLGQKRSYLRS